MTITMVDLFCGAGGANVGTYLALDELGISADDVRAHAVNHWDLAVAVHGLNLPWIHVHHEAIDQVTAKTHRLRNIDLLFAAPSCVHHSRARGGKPRSNQQRSHAWEVMERWLEVARVKVFLMENVPEFQDWCPLDRDEQPIRARKGEYFRAFVRRLRCLGYQVDWRVLCAADYGDPTTRRRLFLQAVCDGREIVWPEPTHRDPRKPATPTNRNLPAWRAAAERIDWSLSCPSIFDRQRPLAEATLRRIATGVVRFVLQGKPFIVNYRGTRPEQLDGSASSVESPLHTISAGGQKHGLVSAFLAKHYGGGPNGVQCPGLHPTQPLGTVTAWDHHGLAQVELSGAVDRSKLVAAFLTSYYSSGGNSQSAGLPLHTVTTIARHGLVTVDIDGTSYAITDIGLRMLEPHELARAMGFPAWYRWEHADGSPLSKRDAVKMIGNACPVGTVKALIKAVVLQRPLAFGLSEVA